MLVVWSWFLTAKPQLVMPRKKGIGFNCVSSVNIRTVPHRQFSVLPGSALVKVFRGEMISKN